MLSGKATVKCPVLWRRDSSTKARRKRGTRVGTEFAIVRSSGSKVRDKPHAYRGTYLSDNALPSFPNPVNSQKPRNLCRSSPHLRRNPPTGTVTDIHLTYHGRIEFPEASPPQGKDPQPPGRPLALVVGPGTSIMDYFQASVLPLSKSVFGSTVMSDGRSCRLAIGINVVSDVFSRSSALHVRIQS